ncbi:MAG: hypothetical protein IIA62_09350, partial [Nitrospinae bacterium]|nr:hypothetical protein [Nitrospinota bacterium]
NRPAHKTHRDFADALLKYLFQELWDRDKGGFFDRLPDPSDVAPLKIGRVIPDANIFSGNIRVQVELSQPHPALFPGLTLEAILRFDSRQNVLHVPSIALAITEQGMVVYIVKNGTAHLVPVRTFKERDEFVEIVDFTQQLGPNVDLILRGSGAVFPGAQVFITNPKPKPEVPFNAADTGKKKRPGNKPEKLAR